MGKSRKIPSGETRMIREGRHIRNPDLVISIQSKTGLKMIFDNEKIITETLVYPDTKTTVIKAKAVRWWHRFFSR